MTQTSHEPRPGRSCITRATSRTSPRTGRPRRDARSRRPRPRPRGARPGRRPALGVRSCSGPRWASSRRSGSSSRRAASRRVSRRAEPRRSALEQPDDVPVGVDVDVLAARVATAGPGIVRISPTSGVMNPAPADSRMSRIGTREAARRGPSGSASWLSEYWVFAMQTGRWPEPEVLVELQRLPRRRQRARSRRRRRPSSRSSGSSRRAARRRGRAAGSRPRRSRRRAQTACGEVGGAVAAVDEVGRDDRVAGAGRERDLADRLDLGRSCRSGTS